MASRARKNGAAIGNRAGVDDPISVRTLCLLFSILFLPMLAIPLVLFGLVYLGKTQFPNTVNESAELPISGNFPPSSSYYTDLSPAQFALVSSWASTVQGHITAPFLILFSFLIAWWMRRRTDEHLVQTGATRNHDEMQIRSILHTRTFRKLWTFIEYFGPQNRGAPTANGAIRVAIIGLTMTLTFTLLIIAGDNWLHNSVQSQTYRYYGEIEHPVLDKSATQPDDIDNPNSPLFSYAGGYATNSTCDDFLNGRNSTPCSLNTYPFYNLDNPSIAYLVLQAGISETSTVDFGGINFTDSFDRQNSYTASANEVITYLDPSTNSNHSFLFYVNSASQNASGNVKNYGYDFVAPSVSMQTTCEPITSACKMETNSSMFACSDIFSGNLSTDSLDGRIRIPGWDTFFYAIGSNGSAHELDLSEDQNPFQYNVTVQIDAISDVVAYLQRESTSQNSDRDILPDPFVHTGNGSVGFALSCSSAVYDVTYSVVNETIRDFRPTLADPKLAAIVRAPLQVGYGRYNLYQAAIMGVIRSAFSDSESLESTLARSFSQVGVALSSGAFEYTVNQQQRMRMDVFVTEVPHASVWFLAIVCLLYALVGLVAFVVALVVRKSEEVRNIQRRIGFEHTNQVVADGMAAYRGVVYEQLKGEVEDQVKTAAKARIYAK